MRPDRRRDLLGRPTYRRLRLSPIPVRAQAELVETFKLLAGPLAFRGRAFSFALFAESILPRKVGTTVYVTAAHHRFANRRRAGGLGCAARIGHAKKIRSHRIA